MKSVKLHIASLSLVSLCLISMVNVADVLPDAGRTLRDIEQIAPVMPAPGGADLQLDQPVRKNHRKTAPGVTFTIRSFHISGNRKVASQYLLPLVRVFCGDNRSLEDIEQAAGRVTQYYRSRGYLVARAYIPPQKVSHGRVNIVVLEGRYGRITLKNKSNTHEAVLKRFLAHDRLGDVVDVNRLDRALLLLQDTVQTGAVNGILSPGSTTGETDFSVAVAQSPAVTGRLEADNYGIRVMGSDRVGGSMQLHNPTGMGDRLDAKILSSGRGQDYAHLAYNLPVGGQGLRLGLEYTELQYRLGEEFGALDAYGTAGVWSALATYPIVRTSLFNLYSELSYDHNHLEDHIDSISSDISKQSDVGNIGLNGNCVDGRGGATTFSLEMSAGDLRIETPAAVATDSVTAHTNGRFSKLGYGFAHHQPLLGKTVLFVSLSGQQAAKNLDSSEKFSLGGPAGVRAYPVGEAAGDDGYVVNAEIRYPTAQPVIDAKLTLIGFIDAGASKANQNPFAVGANERHLSGSGIGASLAAPRRIDVRFSYAWKLSSAPALNDTNRSGRAWLQIVKTF